MSATEKNAGNVVGLIKSDTAPAKTYVLWFHQTDPVNNPDVGILKMYNTTSAAWVPLTDLINYQPLEFRFAKSQCPTVFTFPLADWMIMGDNSPFLFIGNSPQYWSQQSGITGAPVTWNLNPGGDTDNIIRSNNTAGLELTSGGTPQPYMDSDPATVGDWMKPPAWSLAMTITPRFPASGSMYIWAADANDYIAITSTGALVISVAGTTETYNAFFTDLTKKSFVLTQDGGVNSIRVYTSTGLVAPDSGSLSGDFGPPNTMHLFADHIGSNGYIGHIWNYFVFMVELDATQAAAVATEIFTTS